MRERLSLIRDIWQLEALAPEWRALWEEDGRATPFQSPEWLLPWWHAFGADLRTVCIFQEDTVVGLLPFYSYREPQTGERQLLPLGVGTSDYLDGVFSRRCSLEAIEAGVELLCGEPDWDALYVSQLRAGSNLLEAFERSRRADDHRVPGQNCSRTPANTIAQFPRKLRRNCMYYRKRAHRAGTLEFAYADKTTWREVFDALVRLHTERWRDRGQTGVFADERVVRWHREALPLLESAGLLRLCSLRLNGEVIAVLYSLIDPPGRRDRTQYFYLPSYSLSHADLRPGAVLTAMAIEHAAGEGVSTIDMLRGDEEYKRLWHAQPEPTFGFIRFRQTPSEPEADTQEIAA